MADNIIENIEDIDSTLNPITKDHGLEILGNVSDQPVVLRRFSRAIFKIGGLIKGLGDNKEDKFNKNNAFNKNKSDVVNSNDSNILATSKAVKSAYDRGSSGVTKADTAQNSANSAQTKANQAYTLASEKEPTFSKKSGFNLDISHLINSTSKILVASALAVKKAYDKAIEAIGFTNTNKNAIQNNTEQLESLIVKKFGETVLFNGSSGSLGKITLTDNWDNYEKILCVCYSPSSGSGTHRILYTKYLTPSDATNSNNINEITLGVLKEGCFRDTNRNEIYITYSASYITKIIGIGKIS